MKKLAPLTLLVLLVLLEFYLLTGFVPIEWQRAINDVVVRLLPESQNDWSAVTHPRIDAEIQDTIRRSRWLTIAMYSFMVSLIALNTFLIRIVWHRLHRRHNN